MPKACLHPAAESIPDPDPARDAVPDSPRDWRQMTLARLEAWIDEEERLIEQMERRVAKAAAARAARAARA